MIRLDVNVPIKRTVDTLVVGAGPSGLCAAVASARQGAKTLLVERYGALGGNLTLGHVSPIMGRVSAGTLGMEINRMARLKMPIGRVAHDNELLKARLPGWLAAAGVDFYLQTVLVQVLVEDGRVTGAVFTSPEGLFAVGCKVLIDATGDAAAAVLAGAPTATGRESDGLMQPVSLMFTIAGIDDSLAVSPETNTYNVRMPGSSETFRRDCAAASGAGLLPRAAAFVRLYRATRPGECRCNTTQANFIDATKVEDIARAELDLRDQIPHILDFLRLNVRGFERCYLMDSSDTLGVRETRRIQGEVILTEQDVRAARKFEDVVVHDANFILDVHGMKQAGQDVSEKVENYDIPYGCLVPLGVDGLLAVGRCISGTHLASSSYRVMGIAMALGEAGGVAAALCAARGVQPRALPARDVQAVLEARGVVLRGDNHVGME